MGFELREVRTPPVVPNEPLYRRVPTRDEHGRALSDFMMLIPGLRDLPESAYQARLGSIRAVLGSYSEVVFADLNVPRNLLWVSLKPVPGMVAGVAAAIQSQVPEALLVAAGEFPVCTVIPQARRAKFLCLFRV